ncbi:hypothetical protein CS542_01280 [Pedobacter sp. IW39]|nr:hypothetical protein CS542_01280 [Pedobacter sp. IW39]
MQASSSLLKDNFYFRLSFGLQDLPDQVLPPCYRENYSKLRKHAQVAGYQEKQYISFINAV